MKTKGHGPGPFGPIGPNVHSCSHVPIDAHVRSFMIIIIMVTMIVIIMIMIMIMVIIIMMIIIIVNQKKNNLYSRICVQAFYVDAHALVRACVTWYCLTFC